MVVVAEARAAADRTADPRARGGGSSPPVTPTPSASFSDGGHTFSAGRVVSLDVENFALTDDLEVSIDGAPVPAQIIDGRVVFVMPLNISGAKSVVLKNAARSLEVPVNIEALMIPANPASYVANLHAQLDAQLDDLIANASGDELSMLQWAKTKLQEQRDGLNDLDAETLQQMAALLKANGFESLLATASSTSFVSTWQKADLARCNELSDQYPNVFAAAILSTGVVVAGLFPPSPLALVGLAGMVITVKKARGIVGEIGDACLNPFGEPLLTEIGGATLAVDGPALAHKIELGHPFNHNVARTFQVEVEARLLDIIGENLTTLAHRLGGMLRYARQNSSMFAAGVPADIPDSLLNVTREMLIPAEANTYALTGISDARITGTASAAGSTLTLKFAYREGQMPVSAAAFEFALTDVTTNEVVGTYEATLNSIGLPTAYSSSIEVRYGETLTGRLSASFSDRIEIVSQPARGTVTLVDAEAGTFTYHTTSDDPRPDEFTYRAVNAAGYSEPATVEVRVDLTPLYEAAAVGAWRVYYTSETSVYDYTMTLLADGTGYYEVDDTRYGIHWEIRRDSDGYKLYESGFWHPAFDGMSRTALTLPITSFTRHDSAGEGSATFTKL